ncbi:putative DNA primase/helicase [Actinomyces ruminicola]|uniref:Putative DNA primase/helicase n=1 Tax=Actinomyces ruminicola TaxID=332524 RepID=A0A1H0FMF1_9ACTO|nr:phage/plasmid primase, P4 family [Actinomyces ruminicola]SDN95866.1 putative DNA primase/helicase [Actinomyces ruminicola]
MSAFPKPRDNDGWSEPAVPGSLSHAEAMALHEEREATPPPPAEESTGGQRRIAHRFASAYAGRLLYAADLDEWFCWDGKRWAPDVKGERHRLLDECLRQAWGDAYSDKSLKRAVESCQSDRAAEGILSIASRLEPFTVVAEDLDADPRLLNTDNGTVDLRTMAIRPHDPADRITKITHAAWHPDTAPGRWGEFLEQVLTDPAVRRYFRAFVGVALCGATLEQAFTIATGTGANGKGVAYNAILHALGDYGHAAESTLFMSARGKASNASPELMGLMGKRFVVASETERDQPLAAALMKQLTGGDPITARPLYGKPVTFTPTHTALMVTNHLPRVAGDDPAVWRRIRVIPFDFVVPEADRDPELGEKLKLEADAVLAWALEGWRDYQTTNGMPKAAKVTEATDAYQAESDTVTRFISEACVTAPAARVGVQELFGEFQEWAAADGADPIGRHAFARQIESRGFVKRRTASGFVFRGLGLRAEESA